MAWAAVDTIVLCLVRIFLARRAYVRNNNIVKNTCR